MVKKFFGDKPAVGRPSGDEMLAVGIEMKDLLIGHCNALGIDVGSGLTSMGIALGLVLFEHVPDTMQEGAADEMNQITKQTLKWVNEQYKENQPLLDMITQMILGEIKKRSH